MASLNKNIQTGNFIPGSEEYTRPEEIAIMGKYLRAGIQSLNEDIELPTTDSSDTSGKARLVKVKELPGEETLSGINNHNGEIETLNKLRETLKKTDTNLNLSENKETIDSTEENFLSKESFNRLKNYSTLPKGVEKVELDKDRDEIRKRKDISLSKQKETISSNESGDLEVTSSQLYEKMFNENPKNDKRILPDPMNKDSKFKDLDSLLGGVHYDKYSSETLSETKNPTLDALDAHNSGSSDTLFVRSPKIYNKENLELDEEKETLKKGKETSLKNDLVSIKKKEDTLNLDKEKEILKKEKEIKELRGDSEILKKGNSISELNKEIHEISDKKENLKLSDEVEEWNKGTILENLADFSGREDIDKAEVSLNDTRSDIYNNPTKLALSKYIDNLLDGKIEKLSDQKESLPDELKKIVLIDYLKGTIKDDRDLQLAIDNLQEMPQEKVDIILDKFINILNIDLKKISEENGKYFIQGKKIGAENYIKDTTEEIEQILKTNFKELLDIDILKDLLGVGIPIPKSQNPDYTEFVKQLSESYGISRLSAEDLRKTLDELSNCHGSWGKKVAAYLLSILGRYKNFRKYLPEEEVEKFRRILKEEYKYYNEDSGKNTRFYVEMDKVKEATKEEIISETLVTLENHMKDRIRNLKERYISKSDLMKTIAKNKMAHLSFGNVVEEENQFNTFVEGATTFTSTFESVSAEILDNTWDSIKDWLTNTLYNSLFKTSMNLIYDTQRNRIPGHDYSHDTTIRNIPNVVGFYDKKTSTVSFSGSPHSTPMEITSVDKNTSGWFTRTLAKNREYNFKDNYLRAEGVRRTLKDLCDSDLNQVSSVEDLYEVLKNSEKTTAHARTEDGVMNGMTLSSNHVWEITIEPYISRFNGYRTWLPFFQEINRHNYDTHRVRTIYDKWLPITSFELQDKRLINKTLGLYAGEISYPIAMEYSNELRITIADDSFKSFRYYFDKVAEISTYESLVNTINDKSNADSDAVYAKNRNFNDFCFRKVHPNSSSITYKSTFETVDKRKLAVGMYKNLCFRIGIYILTPQYSTIKKYDLLCVMKDYSIEYSGEVDSSPSDVTVTFSVVGETSDQIENIPPVDYISDSLWDFAVNSLDVSNTIGARQESDKLMVDLQGDPILDLSKNPSAPLQTFTDYSSIEIEEEVVEEVDLGSFYKGKDKSHFVTLKDISDNDFSDDEYQKNVQKMMTEKLPKPPTTNTKTKKEKKKK